MVLCYLKKNFFLIFFLDNEFVSPMMHFSTPVLRKPINDNCFVDFCDSVTLASTVSFFLIFF